MCTAGLAMMPGARKVHFYRLPGLGQWAWPCRQPHRMQSQEDRPLSERLLREKPRWQPESVPWPFSPFLIPRPDPRSNESHANSMTTVTLGSTGTSRWGSLRWAPVSLVRMSMENFSCFHLIHFNEISSKPTNLFCCCCWLLCSKYWHRIK